jgi:hypothetical protein
MPGHFTFIGNEWDYIISQPDILLPGVDKISVIFWSVRSKKLTAVTCNSSGNLVDEHDQLLETPEGKHRLQKFRSVSKPQEWIKLEESPLYQETAKGASMDLFSELQNTVLVLRYRNEIDGKYDVLILYLNKNLNQFGVSLTGKVLSTENKSIISSILYHYFKKIHNDNRKNHSILQSTRQSIEAFRGEYRRMKDDIQQVTLSLEEMIVNLARHHLKSLSDQYQREYHFTNDAIEKIKTYRGNISHLPAIIEQAVILAENILYDTRDDIARLDAPMISFHAFQAEPETAGNLKRIDGRESRTIQLLDRLERSATVARSKGLAVTSANVGSFLSPPITAPAITDALKKHRKTIISLMRKYPAKWELIREEFRPVRNLFKDLTEDKGEQGIA